MPSSIRPLRQRALAFVTAVAGLTVMAACADAPTAARPTASPVAANASVAAPLAVVAPSTGSMLACPSTIADSATAVIGPRGGIVGVSGSALVVPAGAVHKPTAFTFVVPASPYVEVEVHPAQGGHYQFAHPVAITVSYARCTPAQLPATSMGAWWVDTNTLEQLGVMAGIDDRQHRRLTFLTDHLSGYLVAY